MSKRYILRIVHILFSIFISYILNLCPRKKWYIPSPMYDSGYHLRAIAVRWQYLTPLGQPPLSQEPFVRLPWARPTCGGVCPFFIF